MKTGRVVVELQIAWWLRPYLLCLLFVATVTASRPDQDKLAAVVKRALKTRVHRC